MELCGFPRPETLGTGKHETTIRDRDMDCAIWPGAIWPRIEARRANCNRRPVGFFSPSPNGCNLKGS